MTVDQHDSSLMTAEGLSPLEVSVLVLMARGPYEYIECNRQNGILVVDCWNTEHNSFGCVLLLPSGVSPFQCPDLIAYRRHRMGRELNNCQSLTEIRDLRAAFAGFSTLVEAVKIAGTPDCPDVRRIGAMWIHYNSDTDSLVTDILNSESDLWK